MRVASTSAKPFAGGVVDRLGQRVEADRSHDGRLGVSGRLDDRRVLDHRRSRADVNGLGVGALLEAEDAERHTRGDDRGDQDDGEDSKECSGQGH